jgi:hypothetical protein
VTAALVPPPESPLLWSVRRAPPRGVRILGWIVGLLFAIGGAWLLHSLLIEPSWPPAIAVGAALGLLIPLSLRGGATARVHASGELVYGFGRHPNVLVPLAAVQEWRLLDQGMLRGIGLRVEPQAVRFLHRKGISYATMRRYREQTGLDLVLEFLTPQDLERLQALQAEFAAKG